MSLLDKLLTAKQGDDLVAHVGRMADAWERIAKAIESVLAIPEPPSPPEVKIGPENITQYGQEWSEEDKEDMRAKLREEGLTDHQIDEQLVKSLFSEDDE